MFTLRNTPDVTIGTRVRHVELDHLAGHCAGQNDEGRHLVRWDYDTSCAVVGRDVHIDDVEVLIP